MRSRRRPRRSGGAVGCVRRSSPEPAGSRVEQVPADRQATVEDLTHHLLAREDPGQGDGRPGHDAEPAFGGVGCRSVGVDGRDLEGELDATHAGQVDRQAEQVRTVGEWRERPGEGQGEVEVVGRVLVLGQPEDGVLEGEQRSGVDLEGEVEVEGTAAPVLGVELHLPDLTE